MLTDATHDPLASVVNESTRKIEARSRKTVQPNAGVDWVEGRLPKRNPDADVGALPTQMDMPIPRLVISDGAGVYGNVFADTNRNLQLDLREPRLAGVRVTMRPSSGEPQETRTSESGEYFFALREDVTGPITVTVQSPEGFAAIRPSVRVFEKVQRLSNVVEGANFPMAALSTQVGGGQVGLTNAPVSLELEPVDGIGGGGSSAIR